MRYKAGWFIPQQILALTHFTPEVTQEDFIGIVNDTNQCLSKVVQPFHLIIDNRIIKSEEVASLELILQSIPQVQSEPLRWIVMVLPHHIRVKASTMDSQKLGDVQLIYVESLAAAFEALQANDTSLNWESQIANFFAEDIIDS